LVAYYGPDGTKIVYNLGDMAWIAASMALVWIMIPGVGLFYSGLLRRKNALSMIWTSLASIAVVSFQVRSAPRDYVNDLLTDTSWKSGSSGGTRWPSARQETPSLAILVSPILVRRHVPKFTYHTPHTRIFWSQGCPRSTVHWQQPHSRHPFLYLSADVCGNNVCLISSFKLRALISVCFYSAALAVGAIAERGRLGPVLVFIFIWTTIVYDPIANWTWNSNGWSFILGGLDFAGGTPVHISSGTAALAISIFLGKRRGYGTERLAYKPNNTTYVILGTVFLWFGWFGFNGGSALSANLRAVQACIVTNLAASVGGLTWMLWDYRIEKKWSAIGFCSGAVSGLVAITPASGFVGARKSPPINSQEQHILTIYLTAAAVAFGVLGGTACNFATQLKFILGYDDALDVRGFLKNFLLFTTSFLESRFSPRTPLAVLWVTSSPASSRRPALLDSMGSPSSPVAGWIGITSSLPINSPIPLPDSPTPSS
jgi:hypothetical protein